MLNFRRLFDSSLFRTSSIYTISNFINAAIPFALLPILTNKLTPADYGIIAMFQITVSLLYPFIGMNLDGAIQRRFYDKGNTNISSYIGGCFLLFAFSLIIISLFFWIFLSKIEELTQIPELWLKYVLVVAASQFIIAIVLIIYQVKVKPIKFGILQISQSVLNVLLTIYFVVLINKSFEGRLESQIITVVFFAIVSFIILLKLKLIRFNFNKKDLQHALKFGVPLIPHAIGGILFSAIDRFFLTNIIGLEQTGNYAVAYQIGAVISIATIAFNNAYVPWLFENLNKNNLIIKRKIVKLTYLYFSLLILGAIFLLLLFPFIVKIFINSKFSSINIYSTFIVFGFIFQGMYYMVTNYITYAEKTYLLALVTISVGLLKIPITYFGILVFGAVGASISYGITFFIFFIATWLLSAKVYKMPWFFMFKLNNRHQ
jgi:O-antigen/teichoic acid export membrane protein